MNLCVECSKSFFPEYRNNTICSDDCRLDRKRRIAREWHKLNKVSRVVKTGFMSLKDHGRLLDRNRAQLTEAVTRLGIK